MMPDEIKYGGSSIQANAPVCGTGEKGSSPLGHPSLRFGRSRKSKH